MVAEVTGEAGRGGEEKIPMPLEEDIRIRDLAEHRDR